MFENTIINLDALGNSCVKIACWWSDFCTFIVYCNKFVI